MPTHTLVGVMKGNNALGIQQRIEYEYPNNSYAENCLFG